MNSILFFEYYATGEGVSVHLFYDSSMSDQEAIDKWKSENNEYFHNDIQMIALSEILDHIRMRNYLKIHAPKMYDYIAADSIKPPVFKLDYKLYFNYA